MGGRSLTLVAAGLASSVGVAVTVEGALRATWLRLGVLLLAGGAVLLRAASFCTCIGNQSSGSHDAFEESGYGVRLIKASHTFLKKNLLEF